MDAADNVLVAAVAAVAASHQSHPFHQQHTYLDEDHDHDHHLQYQLQLQHHNHSTRTTPSSELPPLLYSSVGPSPSPTSPNTFVPSQRESTTSSPAVSPAFLGDHHHPHPVPHPHALGESALRPTILPLRFMKEVLFKDPIHPDAVATTATRRSFPGPVPTPDRNAPGPPPPLALHLHPHPGRTEWSQVFNNLSPPATAQFNAQSFQSFPGELMAESFASPPTPTAILQQQQQRQIHHHHQHKQHQKPQQHQKNQQHQQQQRPLVHASLVGCGAAQVRSPVRSVSHLLNSDKAEAGSRARQDDDQFHDRDSARSQPPISLATRLPELPPPAPSPACHGPVLSPLPQAINDNDPPLPLALMHMRLQHDGAETSGGAVGLRPNLPTIADSLHAESHGHAPMQSQPQSQPQRKPQEQPRHFRIRHPYQVIDPELRTYHSHDAPLRSLQHRWHPAGAAEPYHEGYEHEHEHEHPPHQHSSGLYATGYFPHVPAGFTQAPSTSSPRSNAPGAIPNTVPPSAFPGWSRQLSASLSGRSPMSATSYSRFPEGSPLTSCFHTLPLMRTSALMHEYEGNIDTTHSHGGRSGRSMRGVAQTYSTSALANWETTMETDPASSAQATPPHPSIWATSTMDALVTAVAQAQSPPIPVVVSSSDMHSVSGIRKRSPATPGSMSPLVAPPLAYSLPSLELMPPPAPRHRRCTVVADSDLRANTKGKSIPPRTTQGGKALASSMTGPYPRATIFPANEHEVFEAMPGMVAEGWKFTDKAVLQGDWDIRICHVCRTDTPGANTWRRSLDDQNILCNKCGIFQRTHHKHRKVRPDDHRARFTLAELRVRPPGLQKTDAARSGVAVRKKSRPSLGCSSTSAKRIRKDKNKDPDATGGTSGGSGGSGGDKTSSSSTTLPKVGSKDVKASVAGGVSAARKARMKRRGGDASGSAAGGREAGLSASRGARRKGDDDAYRP